MTQVLEEQRGQDAGAGARAGEGPLFCVMGGCTDASNLGVAALGTSCVKGCLEAYPGARFLMQAFGNDAVLEARLADRTIRMEAINIGDSPSLKHRWGVGHLRAAAKVARTLGKWSAAHNRKLKQLVACDAVLDVAAGDSFADIYGVPRFEYQSALKYLALELGKPLVLLPQTYGPFSRPESIQQTRDIMNRSALVATREINGLEEMRKTFGPLHERVVCVPDMAFLLEPVPSDLAAEPFVRDRGEGPMIGLNVSGLLYLSKTLEFGLKDSYPKLIDALCEWALERKNAKLLLVPHVLADNPIGDDPSKWDLTGDPSDTMACALVYQKLKERHPGRVGCLGWPYTCGQTKYFEGKCDFVIGARMHACIGAISQAVPTVTLAYSKKALGVMSHLDMQEAVLDARDFTVDELVARIDALYERRADLKAKLGEMVPVVKRRAMDFFTRDLRKALSGVTRCR